MLLERNLSGTSYTHSGLAARTTYYYQVRALGAGGAEGPWSDWKQATPGPGGATPTTTPTPVSALTAPTLTAAAAGASAVELSWTAVAGATGYDLDQWDGSAWVLLERNLSGTSYTHSGLAARTTYYYQVRALGAGGAEGPWSDLKQATTGPGGATPTTTPTPVSALTAPTLTAAAAGASAVELSWTAVAGATGYDLDQWDGSAWVLLERNLSGTSYTHSGLAARTTYYYQVRALGAGGAEGPWSDWKQATTFPRTDRAALVALYNAAGGANWTNNTNWLSARPLDEWHGVTTDSNGRVTELNLGFNELSGTIPSELGNLSNLSTLDLGVNRLSGTIPSELGNLSNLWSLVFWGNQLSGTIPSELGNLSSLTGLYLGGNQLSGTIPSELGNLSSLTGLYLYANQLSGTIPSELGNLSSLNELDLSVNQLSGTIPSELGNLSSLNELDLSVNQLSGTIPSELGNLSSLRELILTDNRLSGTIPSELGNLSSLSALNLGNNRLSGTIPSELGNLSSLTGLYLHDNQLSGTIPSELGNLSNLGQLYLIRNQLRGCVPAALRNVKQSDLGRLGLPFCGTQTPTPTPTPTPTSQSVAPPPSSLGLDPFYTKYLDAGGIQVVAPSGVEDAELVQARDIITGMLSDRPDIAAAMRANRYRVAYYDDSGGGTLCQLPEFSDRFSEDCWPGEQASGLAFFTETFAIAGVPPLWRSGVCNGTLIHEFGHLVDFALNRSDSPVYDPGFEPRVTRAYNAAIAAGRWQGLYAATNTSEYWAEAVEYYFVPLYPPPGGGTLADYDPAIAGLVAEVFGDADNADLPSECRQ